LTCLLFLFLAKTSVWSDFCHAASPCDLSKYSDLIQKQEQKLGPILERAQVLEEKYSSPDFIDKFTNIERDRILAQEQFNDKILFGVNLPIDKTGMQINVCNRDWMLLLTVSSLWLADFVFFKMLSGAIKKSLQDLCLQQPEKLLELLKKLDDSLANSGGQKNAYKTEQVDDQEVKKNAIELESFVGKAVRANLARLVATGAIFSVASSTINSVKNHYRLDSKFKQNLMDFALMNVFYRTNSAPIDGSLMEFLKDKSFGDAFSFDLIQTTFLDIVTSFLCDNGLLPEWVNSNKFDLARKAGFASLFIWWSNKNIYKPILFSFLVSNRKNLILLLEKTISNDLEQKKAAEGELESVLQNIPQCSFALWESNKRKHFAQWQIVLNLLILTPVIFKAGAWIYNMNKTGAKDV